MDEITAKERAEFAAHVGIHEQYLYQCLTRRRDMDASKAAKLELETGGRLRRWQLRRDWHLTWPELVGVEGAPDIPSREPTAAKAAS